MQEEAQQEKGPLPRTREAVDWWLKKWGRQAVVEGKEPMTREDVERLIEVNGGTAERLYLFASDLKSADLRKVDLQGANLEYVDLENARVVEAKLQKADLSMAKFKGAHLYESDFQGASLIGADLRDVTLVWGNLQAANLHATSFQGSNLSSTNFQDATLTLADLEGARLDQVNFLGADLSLADLHSARLVEVKISPSTNLEGVVWDKNYISILERNGDYEAAIALYRRLKEWYRGAGMLKIAGEFHYREREAQRKAGWRQLWRDIKQIGHEFKDFKGQVASEWKKLRGEKVESSRKAD